MNSLLKVAKALTILMVLLALVSSCDNSDDPVLAEVSLEMKARTDLFGINTGGRVAGDTLIFHEALIGVTELEFENEEEEANEMGSDSLEVEDEEEELEFEGAFIVDLLNGTSIPDFGIASVIPGIYTEIEADLEPILSDGNTVFIRATYQPEGGEPISLEYSNNYVIEFEFERNPGYELKAGTLHQLLLLFNLDVFFAGVDFNQAEADPDGVIRINQNSNADIASQIEANFGNAFEIGEDNDDDGEIDD